MNEIDVLGEFRNDIAPLSAAARFRGRQRLMAQIAQPRRRTSGGVRARRALTSAAVVLAMAAGIVAYEEIGPPGAQPSAQAAVVLTEAATAVARTNGLKPRPDQFIYTDALHEISNGQITRAQTWTSADGSATGLTRFTMPVCVNPPQPATGVSTVGTSAPTPAPSQDANPCDVTRTSPGYQRSDGLESAPYLVLTTLPTDPQALLKVLYADPAVHLYETTYGDTPDLAVWTLMRYLLPGAPPAQAAAMLRAAAAFPGLGYVDHVTDALGRPGVAVELTDRHLGPIQLIFDRNTYAYLGERVLDAPGAIGPSGFQISDAVRQVAVVDKPGQLPEP
jgi:hypothetical protein